MKAASLNDIRANDGNLSIPLYVRGRVVSEGKGEYAADGLKEAFRAWEESGNALSQSTKNLLKSLSNKILQKIL